VRRCVRARVNRTKTGYYVVVSEGYYVVVSEVDHAKLVSATATEITEDDARGCVKISEACRQRNLEVFGLFAFIECGPT